jgi:hypothetical protein
MKSLLFVILFTCFLISLVITDNSHDVDWMSFIHDEVLLHDITIPGTHDTGTKQIAWQTYTRTQDLRVRDQLKHGIRYLDVRLEIDDNDDDIFLTHAGVDCRDPDPTGPEDKRLYLTKVIDKCINFLKDHNRESIIMHLEFEVLEINKEDAYSKIAGYTFLDPDRKKYIYNNNEDDDETKEQKIPTLGKARGKIVLLTREQYKYKGNNQIDITVEVGKKDMEKCREYAKIEGAANDGEKCYSILYNGIIIQDGVPNDRELVSGLGMF